MCSVVCSTDHWWMHFCHAPSSCSSIISLCASHHSTAAAQCSIIKAPLSALTRTLTNWKSWYRKWRKPPHFPTPFSPTCWVLTVGTQATGRRHSVVPYVCVAPPTDISYLFRTVQLRLFPEAWNPPTIGEMQKYAAGLGAGKPLFPTDNSRFYHYLPWLLIVQWVGPCRLVETEPSTWQKNSHFCVCC